MVDKSGLNNVNQMTDTKDSLGTGSRRWLRGRAALAAAGTLLLAASTAVAQVNTFDLVRSATAEANPTCLVGAEGTVTVTPHEGAEVMKIKVKGLPPNTGFDVFVIQVPNAPFGMSWYQGDLQTNSRGVGHATFRGRFNIETFIVAPNVANAPVVHTTPVADASTNPQTAPVHMYHVGLWFDSPQAAQAAGCPGNSTPFNGDHTAGVQALSTKQFGDTEGPLRNLQ